jgi:hypothetical protein
LESEVCVQLNACRQPARITVSATPDLDHGHDTANDSQGGKESSRCQANCTWCLSLLSSRSGVSGRPWRDATELRRPPASLRHLRIGGFQVWRRVSSVWLAKMHGPRQSEWERPTDKGEDNGAAERLLVVRSVAFVRLVPLSRDTTIGGGKALVPSTISTSPSRPAFTVAPSTRSPPLGRSLGRYGLTLYQAVVASQIPHVVRVSESSANAHLPRDVSTSRRCHTLPFSPERNGAQPSFRRGSRRKPIDWPFPAEGAGHASMRTKLYTPFMTRQTSPPVVKRRGATTATRPPHTTATHHTPHTRSQSSF